MNDPTPLQPVTNGSQAALAEHRALAQRTRLDVEPLTLLASAMQATLQAAVDDDVDRAAVALGVLLSRLPYTHSLAVAARSGLDVASRRRDHAQQMAAASHAIASGRDWRRYGNQWVPRETIERRRAQPGPLARTGVA